MNWLIIIAIILLLAALGLKLATDYKLWLKDKGINHKKEWWRWLVTAGTCAPSIILFTLSSNFFWYLGLPIVCGMCAAFIWLLFDGIYNKLRGFNWWYTGTDDPGDAASDNFLQAIPTWTQIILKTVPLGILIYLYFVSLK